MAPHRSTSLEMKVLAIVCGVAVVFIGVFAWLTIRSERAARIESMIRGASQFSDTVKRSIHYAMLKNQWQDAFQIMDAIAKQEEVDRVRVFNKEGGILFSTDRGEIGRAVDKRAESCYACHAAERPLERLNLPDRTRIFAASGHRLLGMITAIYNEPGCSSGCHVHPPNRQVLGVLDITLSLEKVDEETAAITRNRVGFAGLVLLSLAGVLGFLVRRGVLRPVRELVEGTRKVAQGDLGFRIPVRSQDEVGELAASFNRMTEALEITQAELNGLVGTLEQRVEERTRELKEAQTQLIQTEKLASLGRLSASIAHEINNPLSGILTYAKLISRKLRARVPDANEVVTVLQQLALVERETQRCTTIVRNLLDFARQGVPALQELNVVDVVEEALSLLGNRLEIQNVQVERDLGPVPAVRADFGQLRQAVVNVLINACDAMPAGGVLRVITRSVEAPAGDQPAAGASVDLQIADQGVGIDPQHLTHIFDPFFTTKERGTGLGLSVVYGIIEKHGGRILVESRVGQGTTITLRLPAAGAAVP
jgi:two-component system, NtrC family, sensor kinase